MLQSQLLVVYISIILAIPITVPLDVIRQQQLSLSPFVSTNDVTSIPASRDAPCNETNRRYFELSALKSMNALKFLFIFISVVFYTSPEYS
jgi:hypothetical protein